MKRFHYAWVVVAVTFLSLLAAQSVRAAPGIIITSLESEFGWSRTAISFAISLSILTFGLGGPLGGTLIDRFGPRRVMLVGNALIVAGLLGLLYVRDLWQMYLLWGIPIGLGTGAVGGVLGAAVAHRWFRTQRGVIIGAFGAATSAGQLVFVPAMAQLTVGEGWRWAIGLVLAACALMLVPVAIWMRDRPEDSGAKAFGEGAVVTAAVQAEDRRTTPLRQAMHTRDFWLLAASFFVCGYTSNGLVGTHLIPHAVEHGFTEVMAASAVALLGSMNIVGTLASGWLTDRYDNRKLLAAYYGFRALSLFALPIIYDVRWLFLFAFVYGLDWIATVPPTANLVATIYGRASLGTIYGWIFFSHMVGAAIAAFAGGFFRDLLGDYHLMFVSAGIMGFIAVSLALRISTSAVTRMPAPALEAPATT
ncbi:MAG TPA: MFS transporter [Candidatus Limnocylindria bacterium]|jgi:MFS family permease|nr:MFS transporter [Candidatus Limnocylindria bacterium]